MQKTPPFKAKANCPEHVFSSSLAHITLQRAFPSSYNRLLKAPLTQAIANYAKRLALFQCQANSAKRLSFKPQLYKLKETISQKIRFRGKAPISVFSFKNLTKSNM